MPEDKELPGGYHLTPFVSNVVLTHGSHRVCVAPDSREARLALVEVAQWHRKERVARKAAYDAPLGSELQQQRLRFADEVKSEFEKVKEAAVGTRQWR